MPGPVSQSEDRSECVGNLCLFSIMCDQFTCSAWQGPVFPSLCCLCTQRIHSCVFDLSGQFQFELSLCIFNFICSLWKCLCSSPWVFHLWYASLSVLSRLRSSHLSQGNLLFHLLSLPLKIMNWFCASRRVSLRNWQHSQVPSFSMEASQTIYPNWAWSKLKFLTVCCYLRGKFWIAFLVSQEKMNWCIPLKV